LENQELGGTLPLDCNGDFALSNSQGDCVPIQLIAVPIPGVLTTTVSTTTTATSTITPALICTQQVLQAVGGPPGVDGQYLQLDNLTGSTAQSLIFTSDLSVASKFTIDSNQYLIIGGWNASLHRGFDVDTIYFANTANILNAGFAIQPTCSMQQPLQCSEPRFSWLFQAKNNG